RAVGSLLIDRGYGGHGVADVAHLVRAQSLLILADGQHAVSGWQVFASDHAKNAWQAASVACVDRQDPGMGSRRAQQTAEGHPRQLEVIGVARRARRLR